MPGLPRRNFLRALAALALIAPCVGNAAVFNGVDYMPVSELARKCGMRYKTTEAKKSQVVFGKTTRMAFNVHTRQMSINGISLWLSFPVVEKSGMLYLARRDFLKNIMPILFPQNNARAPSPYRVVIDAGHGAKDNGAQNKRYGAKEKNIALDIALRLGKLLRQYGYKVSYTRTSDTFLELDDRAKFANDSNAGLFLSIHCNAASSRVSGIETFAMTPQYTPSTSSSKVSKSDSKFYPGNENDAWNKLIAYYVQRSLTSATNSSDRGVKSARFAVLRGIKMPGALVECGFISNNAECAKLLNASYRQKIAEAICSAVRNYNNTFWRVSKKK